jgi:hypothetical protein
MDPVIQLKGVPYRLRYDKRAMFRADELGLFGDGQSHGLGLARGAKFIFALLPHEAHAKYKTPEDVAEDMPELVEAWSAIVAAMEEAKSSSEKKAAGSMSGPSQSSS